MKMKSKKIYTATYFIFFMLLTGGLFAQSITNITGTFEGTRSQFDRNHEKLVKDFTYTFELTQKDNLVEGTSTIISEDGNYAEVGIRGVVVKNKFYFEEYQLIDQIKDASMVWCYKSGVLDIITKGNQIVLVGKTPSYMIDYGLACTGGYTKLKGYVETKSDAKRMSAEDKTIAELSLFPVPASNTTSITFTVNESTPLTIEILDLSGRTVVKPETKIVPKGDFSKKFDVSTFVPGLYIVKITIGEVVYTKELVKIK